MMKSQQFRSSNINNLELDKLIVGIRFTYIFTLQSNNCMVFSIALSLIAVMIQSCKYQIDMVMFNSILY